MVQGEFVFRCRGCNSDSVDRIRFAGDREDIRTVQESWEVQGQFFFGCARCYEDNAVDPLFRKEKLMPFDQRRYSVNVAF